MNKKLIHTKNCAGLTLIELIATLAIGSIVLAVGMPAAGYMASNNRLSSTLNSYASGFQFARSTAVTRNIKTIICASDEQGYCRNTNDWTQGLIVFVDRDGNRQRDDNEELLHRVQANPNDIRIISSTRRYKTVFQPSGAASGTNLTLRFCPDDEKVKPKAIVISNTGRLRLTGEKVNGIPVICPNVS